MTGAVASQRVTEAPKGSLSAVGNRAKSVKAEGSLTESQTRQSGTKGSLTGAVASQRVTEAPKGSLSAVGNRAKSVKAEGSLTESQTRQSGTKVGLSDPVASKWKGHRSTDKSYPGDNRLISPKSPYRRGGLAPR